MNPDQESRFVISSDELRQVLDGGLSVNKSLAPKFEETLMAAVKDISNNPSRYSGLVIQFEGGHYVGADGMRALVRAKKEMLAQGLLGPLVIVEPADEPRVLEALGMAGLDILFTFEPFRFDKFEISNR